METNQEKWSHSVGKSFAGTFAALPNGLFGGHPSLGRDWGGGWPPARTWEKLADRTSSWMARTVWLNIGAPGEITNRLKSLRKKEKKRQKGKRKGKREK